MPWHAVSTMSLRREFVQLAQHGVVKMRALCRRFGISPKTGYKWVQRFAAAGEAGLQDQSRRPHGSPTRTDATTEAAVLAVRTAHPAWGGRKIRAYLRGRGHGPLPSPSTITAILRRHGRLEAAESSKHRPWCRFEHETPNRLWQMDFKGHFALSRGGRCHPLTLLDDHSRYALCLQACGNEQGPTVQAVLRTLFRRYGLPDRMLADHGPPWGSAESPYTPLSVWLLRLGISVAHGRPRHPQTQGKEERFHRTVTVEVLRGRTFADLAACQQAFDAWRSVYNGHRPHEALQMATPASRYRPSPRMFPETLPPIEYAPEDLVRKVQDKGIIHYRGRLARVSTAFHGYPVALRSCGQDGLLKIYFCHHCIGHVDLRGPQ